MKMQTEQIKSLIEGKSPSAYHQTLKSRNDLMDFIESSWTFGEAAFKTKLFHVVSGESPVCGYGKTRKVETFTKGYACVRGCGCARDKMQATMVSKYGVSHALQSKELVEKTRDTLEATTGTRNLWEANAEQKKQTNLERYGAATPLESQQIRDKAQETLRKNHGVDYAKDVPGASEKAKATLMERYGVDNYFKTDGAKEKRAAANLEYMKETYPIGWEVLTDKEKFRSFLTGKARMEAAKLLGCKLYMIEHSIMKWDLEEFRGVPSSYEVAIESLLNDLGVTYEKNTRKVIAPKELDYYIPDANLAIEFNGLYWHSEEKGRVQDYHLNKTIACEEKGIRLIQIFSDEWDDHPEICRDLITKALGKTKRIMYARQLAMKEVSHQESETFLEANHLQGGRHGATLRIGLYLGSELVSLMTFGTKESKTELLRFVNAVGVTVVGGASRMFKYARSKITGEIFTYSDRRWFDGSVYRSLGMEAQGTTGVDYHWSDGEKRHHRAKFMKKSLVEQGFDESLTETEIMESRGFEKIWGCGHHIFTSTLT